ncbi:hypothetical protein PVAP13_1NG221257 [Panicum virgatum]|uniref:Uncharacterized protein n=1 Tax=Panicum virgatum TaxID=38727 RepID=A0A8T0WR14_PANVG|nr:hypothetical protein PVAP13_1NG221257 [Panicum virgatum]
MPGRRTRPHLRDGAGWPGQLRRAPQYGRASPALVDLETAPRQSSSTSPLALPLFSSPVMLLAAACAGDVGLSLLDMWGSNLRWEGGGRPPRRAPSCRGRAPGRGGRPGCHGRRVRGGEGWSRVCAGRQRATEGGRMAVRRHAREGEEDGRALCRSRAEPTSRRCTRRGRCPASSLQFGAGRSEGKEWWRSEGGGRWRRRKLRGRKDGGRERRDRGWGGDDRRRRQCGGGERAGAGGRRHGGEGAEEAETAAPGRGAGEAEKAAPGRGAERSGDGTQRKEASGRRWMRRYLLEQ